MTLVRNRNPTSSDSRQETLSAVFKKGDVSIFQLPHPTSNPVLKGGNMGQVMSVLVML